jgi:hypothetical protein
MNLGSFDSSASSSCSSSCLARLASLTLLLLPGLARASTDLLLLGNSYTFVNDLDRLVEALLEEGAPELEDCVPLRLAVGGYRFTDHLAQADGTSGDTAWREALVTGEVPWRWVLLQEQSQIPGFPEEEPLYAQSLAAGAALDAMAADRGAETVLLLTWGRRAGDPDNPTLYPDFATMQARLAEGTLRYADSWSSTDRRVWVAPAGYAFRHVHDEILADAEDPLDPGSLFSRLYQGDGSHPSPLGSYLAACAIFSTLTGLTPVGLSAPSPIAPEEALALQIAAEAAVFVESPEIVYPWEATPPDTGDTGTDPDTEDTGDPDDTGTDEETSSDSGLDSDTGDGNGKKETDSSSMASCGCATGGAPGPWSLLPLALYRRRRSRPPLREGGSRTSP